MLDPIWVQSVCKGYEQTTLVGKKLNLIPVFIIDVALKSDFIAGFCGETEEAHKDTVNLLRKVKYNVVYCYPYSMRQVSAGNKLGATRAK